MIFRHSGTEIFELLSKFELKHSNYQGSTVLHPETTSVGMPGEIKVHSATTTQASFDVVALYPNIPIPTALECVRSRLLSDSTLSERTDWNPDDVMKLLEICSETHSKTIDGRIFKQIDGKPKENSFQALLLTFL